jgi:hypothetical protein
MTLRTYAGILAATPRQFFNSTQLTETVVAECIEQAESWLNRRVDVRRKVSLQKGPITEEFAALPDDYSGVRSFKIDGFDALDFITPEEMAERKAGDYRAAGRPLAYTIVDDMFEFGPAPDGTYYSTLLIRLRLTPISASNPSNWVTLDHPDVYFAGVCWYAARYLDDDREDKYRASFEAGIDDINTSGKTESFAGPLVMRPKRAF